MPTSMALARAGLCALVGFAGAAIAGIQLAGIGALIALVAGLAAASQNKEDADVAIICVGLAAGVGVFLLTRTTIIVSF